MCDESTTDERVKRAAAGEEAALVELFSDHRNRLKRMVELRMDRRLLGRLDASDVVQEAYLDLAQQLPNYVKDPKLPFFLWLRRITGQRLAKLHRTHLGAQKRDAALEVSLYRGRMPQATSFALASQLIGRFTSASGKAMRAERQIKLQEVLNSLDESDREVLALRHFEQLSNHEVAVLLNISDSAAGMRYLRALRRLKQVVAEVPELLDQSTMRSDRGE